MSAFIPGPITINASAPATTTNHSSLSNLNSDDHPQYHTDTRGDARYYTQLALDGGQLDTLYNTKAEITAFLAGKEDSFSKNTAFNKSFGTIVGTVCQGNDARLSDARTPLAHTHPKSQIVDFAHTHLKVDITDFSDADYATAAQGILADSALQSGDNVSLLVNDAGYITSYSETDPVFLASPAATITAPDIISWDDHILLTDNPHSVTATQVGLSNVDNTSDLDKPISTLTQAALDLKSPTSHNHDADYATIAQGLLADSALQDITAESLLDLIDTPATISPGDAGKSLVVNPAEDGFILSTISGGGGTWGSIAGTLADQTDLQAALDLKSPTSHTHVKANITDFSDADYATAAQGILADSAIQSGDNISLLTNNAGYLTSFTETDPVFSASPAFGITAPNISSWNSALQSGDNISVLTNDSGYLTTVTGDARYYTQTQVDALDIEDLANVELSGLVSTQLLAFDGVNWVNSSAIEVTSLLVNSVLTVGLGIEMTGALNQTGNFNNTGYIDTSGYFRCTSDLPSFKFVESDGTAGFNEVWMLQNGDTFSLQHRNGSGGFKATMHVCALDTTVGGAEFWDWNVSAGGGMRLDDAGLGIGTDAPSYKLDVNGDAKISDVLSPENGIVFTGTSTDPDNLDYYEEGTFTPVVADAASGGNEATVSSAAGKYTIIGDVVFYHIELSGIDTTGMTAANILFVTGLPITVGGSYDAVGSLRIINMDSDGTNLLDIFAWIVGGTSYLRFFSNSDAGGNTAIRVRDIVGSGSIFITGHYFR